MLNSSIVTNTAQISVSLMGLDVHASPFKYWTVLPAPFNFTNSEIVEYNLISSYKNNTKLWKRPRCYVGADCTVEFVARDEYCNLVEAEFGVVQYEHTDVNVIGPNSNIDGFPARYFYLRNLSQFNTTNPELYYVNFKLEHVG